MMALKKELVAVPGTSPVTHFEEENEVNIIKSRIKVIKPEKIGEVAGAFQKTMRES